MEFLLSKFIYMVIIVLIFCFSRERKPQDLGEFVEDKEKREKLWNIALAWTKFNENLQQVKKDVASDGEPSEEKSVEVNPGKRWYYLWLA